MHCKFAYIVIYCIKGDQEVTQPQRHSGSKSVEEEEAGAYFVDFLKAILLCGGNLKVEL